MRIVISIVHTKGGVGKTTSAIYLAAAAARQGLRVVVLDADPQGSALLWAQAAAAAGEPMPFTVLAADMRMITAPPTADLVLIDTPPGYPQLIDAAIDAADFVLLPTGASPLDLMRAWPTLQVTAHRPTVLLTQVMLNSKLAVEARAALEDEGVPVLSTPIVRREGVRQAFASVPRDLVGYGDVLAEILEAITEEVPV
jgi:chromosome partitioning protein